MSGSPVPDEDSAPFWEALRAHEVLLQKCANCTRVRFPPMPGCPYCGSPAAEHVKSSGSGKVYSWIVAHRPVGTLKEAELPCTIATIELDEGCRMLGRLDTAVQPEMNLPVAPRFIDHADWTELAFTARPEG